MATQSRSFVRRNKQNTLGRIGKNRRDYTEKSRPQADDHELELQIKNWFGELSVTERQTVFEIESYWMVGMIRQMYTDKIKKGNGFFQLKSCINEQLPHDDLDSYFTYAAWTIHQFDEDPCEKEFELSIRFSETKEYMDTMWLYADIFKEKNPVEFFSLLDQLSEGQALRVPCRVAYDTNTNDWVWENPAWQDLRSFNTLAIWAAGLFERQMWKSFYENNPNLDPRRPGESKRCKLEKRNGSTFFANRSRLSNYWRSLKTKKRHEIL